eukprot:scaffold5532_cov195-Cylindrotheca_fusiformis.AAC.2
MFLETPCKSKKQQDGACKRDVYIFKSRIVGGRMLVNINVQSTDIPFLNATYLGQMESWLSLVLTITNASIVAWKVPELHERS